MIKLLLCVFCSLSLHAVTLGETLFYGNCVTCHDLTEATAAPSIKAIQKRYKEAFETKEKFVTFMIHWVNEPNAKSAMMPKEISKYGLMPLLGYDKESLKEIAVFIYESRFTIP